MWRSIYTKVISAYIILMFFILPCYGEEKNLDRFLFPPLWLKLSEIKYFHYIAVVLDLAPKHEKILGLRRNKLTDFTKLKYKNNIAGIPYRPFKKPPKSYYDLTAKEKKDYGSIYVFVKTIGDEYQLAYYVELNVDYLENNIYEIGMLGMCHKNEIVKKIEGAITELMEDFAITFFKVRGEM